MGNTSKRVFLWPAFLALAASLSMPQMAHAEKRKLLVGAFQDVTIYGDMQVNIVTGKSQSASATGDRRILDLLRIDRYSEHVIVRVQQPPNDDNGIRVKEPLVVTLNTLEIRNISVSGNAQIRVNGIKQDGVSRIILDGGGSIDIDAIKSDTLSVAMSGSGRVTIGQGAVRESTLRIQGSGIYDAQNLQARKFELQQNGNASVKARADESALISNDGAGNIDITGNAECFIRRAGSAIIRCPQDKISSVRASTKK